MNETPKLEKDRDRLDALQSVADRKNCGAYVEGGKLYLRHRSQGGKATVREAIDRWMEEDR